MKKLNLTDVGNEFKSKITVQDYSKKETIDGVKIFELKRFVDDGGSFNEIVRAEAGVVKELENFEIKQVNYSEMEPFAIKAFHLHFSQEDVWIVPSSDRLIVGLFDIRKNSKTYKVSTRLVLGDGKSLLLYIPRGVAHGAANLSNKPARIIYLINQQFDPGNPDERRLPWDLLGKDFWEIQPG